MSPFAKLTGARHRFTSAHEEPFGQAPHAHEWEVWVYFRTKPGPLPQDVRELRAAVEAACEPLQPDLNVRLGQKATGEGIATYLLATFDSDGAVAVRVVRRDEGYDAWVWIRGALG